MSNTLKVVVCALLSMTLESLVKESTLIGDVVWRVDG